jgi:hypothetical protein
MFRGFRLLLATLVVAGVTAGVAAGSGGPTTFPLLGPAGNAFCDGSGVISGTPGGYGTATMWAGPTNMSRLDLVHTSVTITGQQANTVYNIRVIQGIADCDTVDGTITTDANGNGTGSFTETDVSHTALVAVDPSTFTGPHFVTATLHH